MFPNKTYLYIFVCLSVIACMFITHTCIYKNCQCNDHVHFQQQQQQQQQSAASDECDWTDTEDISFTANASDIECGETELEQYKKYQQMNRAEAGGGGGARVRNTLTR